VVISNLKLDVDLFVRRSPNVVACRNGLYSVVSEHFDQLNPAPISGALELHTDGLYCDAVPDLVLMYCDQPGTRCIRTMFADSCRAIELLRAAGMLQPIEQLKVCYQFNPGDEKLHSLIAHHPRSGEPVIHLGPNGLVREAARGATIPLDDVEECMQALYQALEASIVLRHTWSRGDLVAFDNHRFTHGRAPGPVDVDRRLIRVWLTMRA
jgi:alpha-ketoglutarate-dependent taurine dioxygenase